MQITTIDSGGKLIVYENGIANNITVNSGGGVFISSGGTADGITLNSDGNIKICSGGTALNLDWQPFQGRLTITDGAYVTYAKEVTGVWYGSQQTLYSSANILNSKGLSSLCSMYIMNGGVAESTKIYNSAAMYISSGGTANKTIIKGGSMFIYGGGTANNTTVDSYTSTVGYNQVTSVYYGVMHVSHSGVANDTIVNSKGSMYINDGGLANSTTLYGIAYMTLNSGGSANDTILSGGQILINSGGIANNTTAVFSSRGNVEGTFGGIHVHKGGIASNSIINSGGIMQVYDGLANDTTVNSCGSMIVYSGSANDTLVNTGGRMYISSGGMITGGLKIESGANVSAYSGAIIDFTVEKQTDAAVPLIQNWNLISKANQATYTCTINTDQGPGIYSLASNASEFDQTVTIKNTEGIDWGTVSLVDIFTLNGLQYALSLNKSMLNFTITDIEKPDITSVSEPPAEWTKEAVIIVSANDNVGVTSYAVTTENSSINAVWQTSNTFKITENGTYYFWAKDEIGNISEATAITVDKIDNSAPTITGITASITALTNQDVKVTATFSDNAELASKQYKIGDGVWQTYTDGVTVSANDIIYFKATDTAGNTVESQYEVANIDKTVPSITCIAASTTAQTNKDVKVTATFADNIALASKQYKIGNGAWTDYVDGVTVTVNNTVYFKATDTAGNITESQYEVANIDKTDPTISGITASATAQTNKDVKVTATFADNIALASKQYKIGNGAWTDYVDGVTVTANNTVYFKATDTAGNITESQYKVANIDKTDPTITCIAASTTAQTNKDVKVTATFTDNIALASKQYKVGNGEWTDYVDGAVVAENSMVYFKATDTAGNVAETQYKVANIDKIKPIISEKSTSKLAGQDIIINWDTASDASGIAGYKFRYGTTAELSGNGESISTNIFTLKKPADGVYYYQFAAVDNAGNISDWSGTESVTIAINKLPEGAELETPSGNNMGISWIQRIEILAKYIVEYSLDNFKSVIRIETEGTGLSTPTLPVGNWQWRVQYAGAEEWTTCEDKIVVEKPDGVAASEPQKIAAVADDVDDIFFVRSVGTWTAAYIARHTGIKDGWTGTQEAVALKGQNRFGDIFEGCEDANILYLTDDANGDALFVDDVFTESFEDIGKTQSRLANIDEIRAGAGNDIVDMTSSQFDYLGDGMIIRGGAGNDTIWSNNGENFLFGDAGNDRIIGANGDDVIVGGTGDDRMNGGGGDDIFCFGGNWGIDVIEQLDGGTVTLWFGEGITDDDLNIKNLGSHVRIQCGADSITVKNRTADEITLKFSDDAGYDTLADAGAFTEISSGKIFEESQNNILAG